MNYAEFKNEIINFFKEINYLVINEYKEKLPMEKLAKLENFNESSIIFHDTEPLNFDNDKLYVNNKAFFENGNYNIDKLNNLKANFLGKYLEKFVVFDYEKDKQKVMMNFAIENECNRLINKYNLPIDKTNKYQQKYILVLIKNKAGLNYQDHVLNGNVNKLLNSLDDEFIKNEYLKFAKEEDNKEIDEKTEEEQIAQVFGVNLESIEVIKAKGKTFYKVKKDNGYLMLETHSKHSIVEEFKMYQNESENFQTNDSKENSDKIVDSMQSQKIEIKLIPINDLSQSQYKRALETLDIEQIKCVEILFKNKEKYNLEFINIYYGIAIDKNGKCIFAEKNNENGNYEIKSAKTDVYDEIETKTTDINVATQNTDYDNSSNNFETNENEPIEDTIDNPYEIQSETKEKEQKGRQFVKTLPNRNGFIDVLILSLITGFISGFSVGILFILIK